MCAASATVIADSLSPEGVRLITFEVTFARIVLAELNTHKLFSRNSASSRAIPVRKLIERVLTDPYIPTSWGKNQRGMQAEKEVTGEVGARAREQWLYAHPARPAEPQDIDLAHVLKRDLFLDADLALKADPSTMWFGNFRGWVQYRKTIPGESDMLGYLKQKETVR